MKIAFIGQYNKNVEEIASVMTGQGQEVFAYVASNDNVSRNIVIHRGIRLRHVPNFSVKFLNDFFATIHALFCPYDVIHFQGAGAAGFCWMLKIFKPSTKIVTTIHGQNLEQGMSEWLACKFSDKLIVLNKKNKLALKKRYGVCASLIPSGSGNKCTKETDAISEIGLKDKKYILTVGKLCKESGVHFLIEAFKQLEDTAKTTNNFKLVIATQDFQEDEYENYLRVISHGRNNIVFARLENEKIVQQLFSHAYLFVESSVVGSTKTLILEAFGSGLAVLASDVKKNTAVIGKYGFVFEPKSVQSLRDRLAYLLSRPEEVEKMGNSALKQIQNEFGWEAVAKKTLGVYERALDGNSLCHSHENLPTGQAGGNPGFCNSSIK